MELSEHVEEETHLSPQIPPFLFSQLSLHAKVFVHVFDEGVPGFCMGKCGYSPFLAELFLQDMVSIIECELFVLSN